MRKRISIYVFSVLLLMACTEPFDPEIRSPDDVMVVEGMITDATGSHFVRLFMTSPFNEGIQDRPVRHARVVVSDQDFGQVEFTENAPGLYLPPDDFSGKVGHTYELKIETAEGDIYRSGPQTIVPGIQLEELSVEYTHEERPVENVFGEMEYQQVPGLRFAVDIENYDLSSPRMRFENQLLVQYVLEEKDPVIADDPDLSYCRRKLAMDTKVNVAVPFNEYASGRSLHHELVFMPAVITFFGISDDWLFRRLDRRAIIVRQFTLNEDSYVFYKSLHEQMSAEGRIFDPIAAQLRGNMYCVSDPDRPVMGHFEASSLFSASFVLSPEPITANRFWAQRTHDLEYLPEGEDCYVNYRPHGWIF